MSIAGSTDGLWFSFYLDDEEFIAFISSTALQTCFNADDASKGALLRAYRANQALIDSAARDRFMHGATRPIRLTADDFADVSPMPEKTTGPASPYK